jgi:uncharacterized protein (TIGR03792 family)
MGRIVVVIALLLSLGLPTPAAASSGAITLVPERTDVLEMLRLQVPREARACWRRAELDTWEPWLLEQRGYQGRELFWDPERQEALLLIGWGRRGDWIGIPQASVDAVQERFEQSARRCLSAQGLVVTDRVPPVNPYPILSSGELLHERLGTGIGKPGP